MRTYTREALQRPSAEPCTRKRHEYVLHFWTGGEIGLNQCVQAPKRTNKES